MTASDTGALARRIAAVMRAGTALASAVLLAGAICGFAGAAAAATVLLTIGCGMLVAVPVVRLLMMLGWFGRRGERAYAALTVAVLLLIAAGAAAGLLR